MAPKGKGRPQTSVTHPVEGFSPYIFVCFLCVCAAQKVPGLAKKKPYTRLFADGRDLDDDTKKNLPKYNCSTAFHTRSLRVIHRKVRPSLFKKDKDAVLLHIKNRHGPTGLKWAMKYFPRALRPDGTRARTAVAHLDEQALLMHKRARGARSKRNSRTFETAMTAAMAEWKPQMDITIAIPPVGTELLVSFANWRVCYDLCMLSINIFMYVDCIWMPTAARRNGAVHRALPSHISKGVVQ